MAKADSTSQTKKDENAQSASSTTTNENKTAASAEQTVEDSPLEKFFLESVQDIYGAEKSLLEALPKMQAAATTEELQEAIEDHTLQTRKHVSRLEKVFSILGKPPEAKKCPVMEALILEGQEVIKSTPDKSMTRDAALIIASQKVEHYEIASYGGLVQLAITLGLGEVAEILDRTLAEEEDTDSLLTEIAEAHINFDAEEETNEDVEDLM